MGFCWVSEKRFYRLIVLAIRKKKLKTKPKRLRTKRMPRLLPSKLLRACEALPCHQNLLVNDVRNARNWSRSDKRAAPRTKPNVLKQRTVNVLKFDKKRSKQRKTVDMSVKRTVEVMVNVLRPDKKRSRRKRRVARSAKRTVEVMVNALRPDKKRSSRRRKVAKNAKRTAVEMVNVPRPEKKRSRKRKPKKWPPNKSPRACAVFRCPDQLANDVTNANN